MSSSNPVIVRSAPEVLSLHHGVSFWALALAAGAVNAGAFLACRTFVSHVTGTVTTIGMDVKSLFLMLDYVLVLVAFLAGAMSSVIFLQARVKRGLAPMPAVALLVVAAVLSATAVMGQLGVFGPVGGEVEQRGDFALICVLAFAMGLLNATVATTTALSVRVTHMTGPATDVGVHLGAAVVGEGEDRKQQLKMAALRGSKIIAFAVGAALMVPTIAFLEHAAFLMPAAFVVWAAKRTFAATTQARQQTQTGALQTGH